MNNYRYYLDKSSKKFKCPACGKKSFVCYKDGNTDDYLRDEFGRCDREINCGYHMNPYKQRFNKTNWNSDSNTDYTGPVTVRQKEKVEYLPFELVKRSMVRYYENNFILYLKSLFGDDLANDLALKYNIGTSKEWSGATAFWQIDKDRNARQCKIMLYDASTGRRVKDEYGAKIRFKGKKILDNDSAVLRQCFFGEHLLPKHPEMKVAICESEKTAIISSVFLPEYVWLATGGKQGCSLVTIEVCQALDQRDVTLFPDLGAFKDWYGKAIEMRKMTTAKIKVSDVLERNANADQKRAQYDLADFLVVRNEVSGCAIGLNGYPIMWDTRPNSKYN